MGLGDAERALDAVRRARELDPADASLVLREAQFLYDAGRREESRRLLEGWLDVNRGPVLAILLYHGLAADERDPMLASRIHLPTRVFAGQLTALKRAGFVPVTSRAIRAWCEGGKPLPDKAVWITFDDGRLDSLREATPVLRELDWSAAMFVAGTNADRILPGYATWPELAAFLAEGFWEFHSHGDRASDRIEVSSHGRRETSLPNRRWLAPEGVLESEAEWLERIEGDYRHGREMLRANLGVEAPAFAWPEGDFGQEGIPNAPGAAARNMSLARKYHPMALRQDAYGLNVRSQDPLRLARLEPKPEWSGADLVRQIEDNDPRLRVAMELLKQAVWQGSLAEARQRLAVLRDFDPPEGMSMTAEAMIASAAGDQASARRLLRKVSDAEAARTKEYASVADAVERRDKPVLRASFRFWADEDDRRNLQAATSYEGAALPRLRWQAGAGAAEYRDPAVDDIRETFVSLLLTAKPAPGQSLSLGGAAHAFSGPAADEVTWSASWDATWDRGWRTVLGAGRNLIFTGEALAAGIASDAVLGEGIWTPGGSWELRLRGAHAQLSDDNERNTAAAEASVGLPSPPGLRLVGRFTYDDALEESEAYYSPRNLRQGSLGLAWSAEPRPGLKTRLRYLPGYGVEDGSDARIVHSLDFDARLRLGPQSELRPILNYYLTPSYSSGGANVSWSYRF
jgi:peptidoglycan/xylan/chitin deacetylase (PgdA/CDA1 family)